MCQSVSSLHRLAHLIVITIWGIKNCEELEILPYLQASKVVYNGFIDAGRRYKTLGSETKDFISHRKSSNQSISIFLGHFSKQQFPQDNRKKKVRWQWLHYKRRTLNLGDLNSLKWTVSMPFFAPKGDTIIFVQGYFLYRHPWTHRPEQRQSVPLLAGHTEM